jgi:Uncharacterized conserved protein
MQTASTVAPRLGPWLDLFDEFAAAVVDGLSKPRKTLPCRFFYDARGSELFEKITRLPEYYLTRTEVAILSAHAPDIAENIPHGGVLVEFGSGSSLKTEILLERLPTGVSYVPIDVSQSALAEAKRRLSIASHISMCAPSSLISPARSGFRTTSARGPELDSFLARPSAT